MCDIHIPGIHSHNVLQGIHLSVIKSPPDFIMKIK